VGRQIGSALGPDERDKLAVRLEALRDELLEHFANEEEALFPFLRKVASGKTADVDRLETGHDAICGAVVRLAHMVENDVQTDALAAAYKRFELTYGEHSRNEAELFKELGGLLDERHRVELAGLLRGL
jgi:iron-sulfur cluster repair protein YtfE (RIC family)